MSSNSVEYNKSFKVRMFISDYEIDKQFHLDDPMHIPRVGEFVESDTISGFVGHVQYTYMEYDRCIVRVYLKDGN